MFLSLKFVLIAIKIFRSIFKTLVTSCFQWLASTEDGQRTAAIGCASTALGSVECLHGSVTLLVELHYSFCRFLYLNKFFSWAILFRAFSTFW